MTHLPPSPEPDPDNLKDKEIIEDLKPEPSKQVSTEENNLDDANKNIDLIIAVAIIAVVSVIPEIAKEIIRGISLIIANNINFLFPILKLLMYFTLFASMSKYAYSDEQRIILQERIDETKIYPILKKYNTDSSKFFKIMTYMITSTPLNTMALTILIFYIMIAIVETAKELSGKGIYLIFVFIVICCIFTVYKMVKQNKEREAKQE